MCLTDDPRCGRGVDATKPPFRPACGLIGHYTGDDRQLSGKILVNLCLAGSATMTYTRDQGSGAASYRAALLRRGLQIQSGEVRYNYQHGIQNRDFDDDRRVSITFRDNKYAGHHV